MNSFALGVATVILTTGYGARNLILRHRGQMQILSRWRSPYWALCLCFLGLPFILNLHHPLQAWVLNALPEWMVILSVSI